MILLEIRDAAGRLLGQCDATCYDAHTPNCHCICGGSNHGQGLHAAARNVRDNAQHFLLAWIKAHPYMQPEVVITHKALDMLAEQKHLPLEY